MTHDLFGVYGYKPNHSCQLIEGCYVLDACPVAGLKLSRSDLWVCDDQSARCASTGRWLSADQWETDPLNAVHMLKAHWEKAHG